jgi:hypothetical protein
MNFDRDFYFNDDINLYYLMQSDFNEVIRKRLNELKKISIEMK